MVRVKHWACAPADVDGAVRLREITLACRLRLRRDRLPHLGRQIASQHMGSMCVRQLSALGPRAGWRVAEVCELAASARRRGLGGPDGLTTGGTSETQIAALDGCADLLMILRYQKSQGDADGPARHDSVWG